MPAPKVRNHSLQPDGLGIRSDSLAPAWDNQGSSDMPELTRRDFGGGLGALAFGAQMMGLRPAAAQGAPQAGGVLNIGFPSDSKTLDPTYSVQFTERQVLY